MTGGGDLNLIAGQEMYGDAADVLAGVVGDGSDFAVTKLLCLDLLQPSVVLCLISESRKSF
ncbi:hypothetical protein A7X87_05725 [Stenotrophomonas maltophilia]|nr:hypothetical protein A7X87_05725 [Stenotrophomonas maltophilia]